MPFVSLVEPVAFQDCREEVGRGITFPFGAVIAAEHKMQSQFLKNKNVLPRTAPMQDRFCRTVSLH